MKRVLYVLLLAALGWAAPVLAAEQSGAESFRLKNGMEVVLIPNHRVPAVTHMLWYRVGAADDYPGRSGLAHYNEHMMFQGTEKLAGGEFARRVSAHGGRANAFTSHDYTGYYVSIAKEFLPLVMEMEADRMQHLAPTPANFAKEREVIIEERRMSVENNPDALLSEEMHAILYRNHPYHTPIIGWMHEMQGLSREDVLAFHRQFYQPANAVLVVTGDITRQELQPLAEQYYGSLVARAPYVRHWAEEPPQRGARHIVMHSPLVKQPQWARIYMAPSVHGVESAQALPTYLLAQLLGGGATSALYQSLVVRQHLATDISADYEGIMQGPGEFSLQATLASGVTPERFEAALDHALADFRAELDKNALPADQLSRAKTLLKAETLYARDGLEGMARITGTLLMAGLPADYFFTWPERIEQVSMTQLPAAAKQALRMENSVTGLLLPEAEALPEAGGAP